MGCFCLARGRSEGLTVGLGGEEATSPARFYCIFEQERKSKRRYGICQEFTAERHSITDAHDRTVEEG
jgi:hypothetical protein